VYVVLSLDKNAYSISAYTLLFVGFVWRQLEQCVFCAYGFGCTHFFILEKDMKREVLTIEEMNHYLRYIIIRIVKYHPTITKENIIGIIKKYYIVDESIFDAEFNTILNHLIDCNWLIALIINREKYYTITKCGNEKYAQKTVSLSDRAIDILYIMDF